MFRKKGPNKRGLAVGGESAPQGVATPVVKRRLQLPSSGGTEDVSERKEYRGGRDTKEDTESDRRADLRERRPSHSKKLEMGEVFEQRQNRPTAVPVSENVSSGGGYSETACGLTREELNNIKQSYLGLNTRKRKLTKPSEKFRNVFQFEWSNKEDTTMGDTNPLYAKRLQPQLLFGRGFIAGVDVREQRKTNDFYDRIVLNRGNIDEKKYLEMREKAHARMTTTTEDGLHWSEKPLTEMNERDWRILREDFQIQIKGGRVPPPARNWPETKLPIDILRAVESVGYEKPSAIQMQSIPIAMELRDMIGIAETGSGKTAAFCLPLLAYLNKLPRITPENASNGPYSLILAPSRELAQQIEGEFNKFAKFINVKCACCVGGLSIDMQAFTLHQGVEVVVGTPGRVKDILENSMTVLNQCYYVVLDEADKMIDLGFEEIVTWIMDQIPNNNMKHDDEEEAEEDIQRALAEFEARGQLTVRLTHLFSATMPPAVERMSRKYLRAPSYISIGEPGGGKKSINQIVEFVAEGKKMQKCIEVLSQFDAPIIIFTNLKKVVDVLVKKLLSEGYSAVGLHGGKAQDMRQGNLENFKNGTADILVATDVAGRGIDVDGVTLVINLDVPKDIESYTHRIGRTGRAGKTGTAISFLTDADTEIFFDLKQFLEKNGQPVPRELANHEAAKVKPGTVKSIRME